MGNTLPCSRGTNVNSKRGSDQPSIYNQTSTQGQDGLPTKKMLDYPCHLQLGPMPVPVSLPSVLIAGWSRDSVQLKTIRSAACQLELDVSWADTTEMADTEFRQNRQGLVILDLAQSNRFSPQAFIKSIRSVDGSDSNTSVVGILTNAVMEKEEGVVLQWLGMGVSQVLTEGLSRTYWTNHIIQILLGPVWTKTCISATQTLFTALDSVKDIVQITDKDSKVLWVNHAAETELGWSKEEIQGRDLTEMQTTGSTDLNLGWKDNDPWFTNRLHEGKIWEGPINCRRKTGDYAPLASRVLPVNLQKNRSGLNQIVYVKTRSSSPTIASRINKNSPSVVRVARHQSLKKVTTTDANFSHHSEGYHVNSPRRRSSGKIHTMSIEAPITKVINIILAAQENQPVYIAQALDKVVEILKSSGSSDLFNPEMDRTGSKRQDLVTKDLLGALLANSKNEPNSKGLHRRSSCEKTVSFSPRPSAPTIEVTPVQIGELLSTSQKWGFDIIKLEDLTEKRPLLWLGMHILLKFQVTKILNVEEGVIQNWLNLIESNYQATNAYHNSTHAADVLQSAAYFLERAQVQELMDPVDELVVLIGAIIHDVGHPGRNSAFLCNSGSELAVLYNDTTVLENHHCALGYKLTTSQDSVNIFKNLDTETYKLVRKGLIDTVLATDMSKHFVLVNKFTTVFGTGSEDDIPSSVPITETEQKGVVRRMLIKCADVSNPARPLELCKEWALRIAEEYFSQTEEEKRLGLPVLMPQFDRATCSIPQSQIGFYDFFIHSMFEAWNNYSDCGELIENINANAEYWKKRLEEELESGTRIQFRRGERASRHNKNPRGSKDASTDIIEEPADEEEGSSSNPEVDQVKLTLHDTTPPPPPQQQQQQQPQQPESEQPISANHSTTSDQPMTGEPGPPPRS